MTVDFMSVKTVSSSSLKAEKEALRKIEQEKTQALEQVRECLKCFNLLICLYSTDKTLILILLAKYFIFCGV